MRKSKDMHLDRLQGLRATVGGLKMALLLAALGGLAGTVRAESVWLKMARAISPEAKPVELAPVSEGDAPSVAPAVLGGGSAESALVSLQPEYSSQTITGLAIAPGSGLSSGRIDLGLESEENAALFATDLFKNQEIRRMLGDEPRFIYDPGRKPDPMLLLWVRNAAIFRELSEQAEALVEAEQFEEAIVLYQRVKELGEPQYHAAAQQKLTEIALLQQDLIEELVGETTIENIELPPWVRDNTTGIIKSPGIDLCLVGEFMLRVGDVLPNYPEIEVASIEGKRVIYQIKHQTFEVELPEED